MSANLDPQRVPAPEDDSKFWEEVERSQACEFLFRAIVSPVVIYDACGVAIRANAAALESYGLDPTTLGRLDVAKQFRVRYVDGRLVPAEDLPTTRALWGEVVKSERYVFTNARGEEHTILASVTPLWDGPHLRGAVSVWQDITQQLHAEEDRFERYDGRVQWLRWGIHPWYLASDQVGGIVMFTEDITERKQEQERLLEIERTRARLAQTMADEIAHRTKNNLAIVAGLLQTQIDRQADRPLESGLVHDAIARIHTFAVLHEQMHQTQGEEVELVTALRLLAEREN